MRKVGIVKSLLQIAVLLNIIAYFISCASTGKPQAKERSLIQEGKQSIVLLRINGTLDDGKFVEPFPNSFYQDNMNIGVCSDDPEGKVERVTSQKFLSPETRKQGWIYLILKPGTHYLAFQGARTTMPFIWDKQLQRARRLRIDIPEITPVIYAGTLKLRCRNVWNIVGARNCHFYDESRMVIQDETNLAKKVTADHISDYGTLQTVLMKRYD
jgi:hypothetical protein